MSPRQGTLVRNITSAGILEVSRRFYTGLEFGRFALSYESMMFGWGTPNSDPNCGDFGSKPCSQRGVGRNAGAEYGAFTNSNLCVQCIPPGNLLLIIYTGVIILSFQGFKRIVKFSPDRIA